MEFNTDLRYLLSKNPVASTASFTAILWGVEKMVEMDFVCPCMEKLNMWFFALHCAGPAVACFALGFYYMRSTLYSLCLSLFWLLLIFYDGRYLACGLEDANHNVTVVIEKHSPWKVCDCSSEVTERNILEVPDYVIWSRVSRIGAVAVVIAMIMQCVVFYSMLQYILYIYYSIVFYLYFIKKNLYCFILSLSLVHHPSHCPHLVPCWTAISNKNDQKDCQSKMDASTRVALQPDLRLLSVVLSVLVNEMFGQTDSTIQAY